MPQICRINDKTSGHEDWPPTTIIEGSSNTFVNGLPVARQGDKTMIHCNPKKKCHPGSCMADNGYKVFVNGRKVHCVGDHITCQPKKHKSVAGSNNTNAG